MEKILKNKKGGEGMPWWIILMIVAALFLLVWLTISGKIFGGFSEQTTAKIIEQKLEACKAKGEKGQLDGTPYPDRDNDGLPDYCDNCPYTPNFGTEVEDKDNDGFPLIKDKKLQNPSSQNGKLCCGNDGKGNDNPKITEKIDKYCETQNNDLTYGPKKLILSYAFPTKS